MSEANDAQVLAEAKKLAMADRVAHANWKVRSAAYEDIRDTCSKVYDEADKCLTEYCRSMGVMGKQGGRVGRHTGFSCGLRGASATFCICLREADGSDPAGIRSLSVPQGDA